MNLLKLLCPTAAMLLPACAQTPGELYAQKLVDEILAKRKDVVILAMHVTPPGRTTNVIIASNIGRIGKPADEDDLRVIQTGKPNLEVNATGNHFEVELVLEDASGRNIGALGVVFDYKPGADKSAMQKKAEQVRAELRSRTPTKDKLFETVPWP